MYEIDETPDGQMFLAMAFYEGATLSEKIKQGPVKIDEALEMAIQATEGLKAAHKKGITHRDIKSSNIMVTTEGQLKIMDFGLAKTTGATMLTKSGATVGTVPYMSPEQARGEKVDHRTDIWSLGVVLYEMISGRLPFESPYSEAIVYSILNEEPKPFSLVRSDVPANLETIVRKCLEKNPSNRYQHADELIVDLRRLKKETSRVSRAHIPEMPATEAHQQAPTAPVLAALGSVKKRWVALAAASILFVAMIVTGYFLLFRPSENGERIPVAVADFLNQTSEPELDGLSGMLITSLEQSRRLTVLTRSRMFDILKQMGRDNVDRIDEALGRELCRRANVRAFVIASIRKFDQLYTVDLKILDPDKNEYLFTSNDKGEGKASIPAIIDRISERARVGLREKVSEVQASKQKVAEVTTTNLQAYKHYFEGEQLINKMKLAEAADEFRKAVSLDSMFTLAYWRLAYALVWFESSGADEAIRKAMLYIDKVPEKERYYIRGQDAFIRNDLQQGLSIYKELLRLYPEEKEALYFIGDLSFHLADFPTAIEHLEKVLARDPTFERAYQHLTASLTFDKEFEKKSEVTKQYVARVPNEESYSLLADAYVNQAKFDSALAVYRRALELFPASGMPVTGIGRTLVLLGDFQRAETEFNKLIRESRPVEDQRQGYLNLASLNIYRGKYREAFKYFDKCIELDLKERNKPRLGRTYATKAIWLLLLTGDKENAKQAVDRALTIQTAGGIFFNVNGALFNFYVAAGDYEKALSAGKQVSVIFPFYQAMVNGSMHQANGEFYAAIPDFLAIPMKVSFGLELLSYRLAQCYAETGQFEKAIEELSKIEKDYSNGNYYFFLSGASRAAVYPRALYLMGTLHEKKGDKKLAAEYYQRLFSL